MPNPYALRGATGYEHPDDSNGFQTFGSKCTPNGNCGRPVVGGLYARTAEIATNLVPKIVQRAEELGMQIVAKGHIFKHIFIK